MQEIDKQNLEQIAREKEYLQRKDVLLDRKIVAIQKSTKTSFKLFNSIHNKCRAKWHWYYKWHLSPLSNIFHYTVLAFIISSVALYGMMSFGGQIQRARAADWTSVASGNWSDQCTWVASCDGGTPASGDSVTIATGTTVTVTSDASITGITIANSATAILTINTTKTLTASGTVTIGAAGFIQGAGTLALPDGAGANLSTTGNLNSLVQFITATTDVTIPARTYGGNVTIYNNTATDFNATLGTGAGQTINFSGNLTLSPKGTGKLMLTGVANNPIVNLAGDFSAGYVAGEANKNYNLGTGTWTVSGNWTTGNGTNEIASNTLIFNGNGKTIATNYDQCKITIIRGNVTFSGNYSVTGTGSSFTVDAGYTASITGLVVMNDPSATLTLNGTITGSGELQFGGLNTGTLLNGNGTISVNTTSFKNACANSTIPGRSYYGNVTLSTGNCTSSPYTVYLGKNNGDNINIYGNLILQTPGTGNVTFDGTSKNPNFNVYGNLTTTKSSSGAVNVLMGSGAWTVYGNTDLTGSTVTPGTSTLDFARMTGTQTFNAGGQTVGNVTHSGAGTLQLVTGAASVADLTLNQTYTKKKAITIDHTKVGSTTEDETNFPMLVSLTDTDLRTTGNGGSVTNANGYDIIFADSNGVKLDHEIEKYTATTGEIIMWVRIPLLSKTTDTVITMLYGNTSITTTQEVKTGVWMNGYAGVWHLKETSGQHADSTANANNSTTVNVTTQGSATGKVDGSDTFTRTSNNYVSIPNNSSLNFGSSTNFTITGWTKFTATASGVWQIADKADSTGSPFQGWTVCEYWKQIEFKLFDTTGHSITLGAGGPDKNDGNWHHFAIMSDRKGNSSLYVDNSFVASASIASFGDIDDTGVPLVLGGDSSGTSGNFDGGIDEIHVSTGLKSAGWISTEYANQNDPASFYKSISPALNSAGTATTPTIDLNAQALNVGGNFVGSSQQVFGTTGTLSMNATTTGHTVTSNGMTIPNISFSGTNGAWNLADNFVTSGDITINTGATLNTYINPNSYNVNCMNMTTNTGGTLYAGVNDSSGTSTINVSGNFSAGPAYGTFTYGKSNVNLTGTGTIRTGGSVTFYDLTAAASGKTTTYDAIPVTIAHVLTLGTGTFKASVYPSGYSANLSGCGTPLVLNGTNILQANLYFNGNCDTNVPVANYGTLWIMANSHTATLQGNISVADELRVRGANADSFTTLDSDNYNINVKTLSVGESSYTGLGSTLNMGSGILTVSQNATIYPTDATYINALNFTTGTANITGNLVNSDTITTTGSATIGVTSSVTNNAGGVITANSSTWNVLGSVTNNASATITAGTSTWNVGDATGTDSWTNSGTFTYNTSMVNLLGTGNANGSFYDLHAAATSKTTTLTGYSYVYNVLTLGNGTFGGYGQTIELKSGGTPLVTAGATISPSITYNSTGANVTGTTYSGQYPLNIYGTGTYTAAGNIICAGGFGIGTSQNGSTSSFDTGGYTFSATTLGIGTAAYTRQNTFKATGSGAVTFTGNVTNNYGTGLGQNTIDLSTYSGTMSIGGNFANGDYLLSGNSSTVNFNGTVAAQTITAGGTDGNHDFNNITVTNTHANGVTFADDATISGTLTATDSNVKKIAVTNGKTLSVKNLSLEGNHSTRLALVSTSAGNTFALSDLSGTKTVSYVDVKDSVASSEIIGSESKDSGNNTNWMLVKTLTFNITSTTGHVQVGEAATITAKDGTGANTNAVGDGLTLSANHGNITPTSLISSNFTAGAWAGNITLDYVGAVTVTVALHGLTSLTDTITMLPGVLDHFTVTGTPASPTVRSAFTNPVIVTAYDAFGNVKIDYVGQMYFTSTDGSAVLPYTSGSKYTFTGLDAGYHSFAGAGFTLMTTGVKTISAVDGSVSTSSTNITVMPAAIGTFTMTGYPATKKAGEFFGSPTYDITVTAKDIFGNTKTDYTGIVWFASTDSNGSVALPYTSGAPYTFIGGNNGVKVFGGDTFKLATTGNQTITLSDGAGGGTDVTSSNILVTPADFDHFTLSDYPQASANQFATAGYDWSTVGSGGGTNSPYDVIVSAYDAYGNVKTDFVEPIWFEVGGGITSAFPYDSSQNSYTFDTNGGTVRGAKTDAKDNGRHIFDANTFTISTTGSNMNFYVKKNGYSGTFVIKIKPAPIASVGVIFSPILRTKPVDTALTESVIITAYDSVGNVKTDYVGDMYFTSSDTAATLPYNEQSKYTFLDVDAGTKTYTPQNTPSNYFNFHTGGNQTLTAVASADTGTVSGNSATFTVSAHMPTEIQATAGYQQVILDWLNPVDPAVSNVNIYQSTTPGVLGSKIASPNVNSGTYSQYIDTGLTNGTPYYYTLASVVKTPQNTEYESVVSSQVTATPADIAARNISANQLADGRVKIDYDLRYTSTVSIDYYNPANSQWLAASAPTQSGDIGANQAGQDVGPDLIGHTAYWTAKTDFDGKYYTSAQGFKIRIKVLVPSQGNAVANSPSPSFQLDTKNPGSATLTVDASGDSTATLSIHALEDGVNTITMMIANEPTFAGKNYQTYASSITNWNLEGSETVYVKFKDPYSNTTTVSTALVPVVMNFMLKDVSDLRTPAYQLFTSWSASNIQNLQNYIVEYQTNGTTFAELIRTNQTGYVHLNLDKETLYGYRIKTIDTLGNISRPSAVLSSKPGLAPDITSVPMAQVFGYKQDVGVRVIVQWNTDQLADSFVAFSIDQITNEQNTITVTGQSANLIGQLDRAQEHEVTITNLLPGKKYYMKALSQNDQKITGYSNVFEISTPEYLPLQIKALKITELKTDSAWVSWETNKVSKTSVLLYGEGDKFDRTITDNSLNSDHKFKLEDLIPGVEYKLKIEATDEDGNSVVSDEYSFLPPARPEISGVTVSAILNNSATISWDSNVNTDSNVEYSTKDQVASQAGKTDLTTKHMVVLTGLESNTTYSFKAKSKDDFGNEAVSGEQSFTTISDTTAPLLTEIQSQLSQVTSPQGPKYQAVISWKTDEGSSSQVEYGDNAAGKYSKKTQEDPSLNMTHVVILSDMKPNSAYSYRIISKDKASNEAVSTNYTVITPPQEQSLIQAIIANLTDSFSWVGRLRTKWFGK